MAGDPGLSRSVTSVPLLNRAWRAVLPHGTGAGSGPIGATSGAVVFGGGLWKVVSTALPQLYSLVLSVVAARFLGPAGMGRQSFIAFLELSVISLLAGGMSLSVMRNVGEAVGRGETGAVRRLVRFAWRLELAGAAIGGVGLAAAGIAGASPRDAWILAAVATAAGIVQSIPAALLSGLQRWRQASIAGLVTGGLATAATALVLALGGRITAMFAVEAAASVLGLAWTSTLARRSLQDLSTEGGGAPPLRALKRFALLGSVGVILDLVVWRRSEFFFLAHYSSGAEIAYYSIAFALASGVVRLPASIGTVITPAVANLVGTGERERIRTGFDRATRLLLLCTMPLIGAAIALGPRVIEIVWGSDYQRAGRVLVILAAASILTPLTALSESLLAGLGQLRVPVLAGCFAAVVDIGLAFLLVPRFGATGAAFANGGAQLTSAALLIVYASLRTRSASWASTPLVRAGLGSAAAAGAAAAVVATVPGAAGLIAAAAVGGATFLGLSPVLRVMSRADAEWLERAAGHRLGGLVGVGARVLSGRLRGE